ncbi:hypothetical protein Tco_0690792 [Tanacetum coccineum]
MSLHTTIHAQMLEIRELQSVDRRRQIAISDLLKTDRERRKEMRELRVANHSVATSGSVRLQMILLFSISCVPRPWRLEHALTHWRTLVAVPRLCAALAARDATRNGVDSHTSGTGGTEGVVELTQWFERMETVFRISNCSVENQPKTIQEAIEMVTELMDMRISIVAERQVENKRKFEDTPRNNQNQQQNKRQNTGRAYAAGNGDKKPYEGTKPLFPKNGTMTAIIGMDWFDEYQAGYDCANKDDRIPCWERKLNFHGDGRRNKRGTVDKSNEKQLQDVPFVQIIFPKYFPRLASLLLPDSGISHRSRVPSVSPVAHAPYDLVPIKNERISDQLQELFLRQGFIRDLVRHQGSSSSIRQEKDGLFRKANVVADALSRKERLKQRKLENIRKRMLEYAD